MKHFRRTPSDVARPFVKRMQLRKKAVHNIEMRVRHEICRAFSTTEGARLWVTLLVEVATRDGRRQREWP